MAPLPHRRAFRALFACSLLSSLAAGCGGGGGSATSRSSVDATAADVPVCRAAYAPAYVERLSGLRRWRSFPVRVRFATATAYRDSFGNAAPLEERLRDGFDRWREATGGAVTWTETADPADADITVSVRMLGARRADRVLASTTVRWNGPETRLRAAEMVVYGWDGMSAGDVAALSATGTHEFGHALGLDGHSDDPADVMYPSGNGSGRITARDLNTLRSGYCGFSASAESRRAAAPSSVTATNAATVVCLHPR